MKTQLTILLKVFLLIALSSACTAREESSIISDIRLSLDQTGENATSTFSPSDVIYLVVDLANASRGTKLDVKWVAVNAEGTERNHEFDSQTMEITDELFTGTTFFQLSNAVPWPVGEYKVDLYLNDTFAEGLEFRIQ